MLENLEIQALLCYILDQKSGEKPRMGKYRETGAVEPIKKRFKLINTRIEIMDNSLGRIQAAKRGV